MKTLTVKSPLSVPYLFFTRMLYLPESIVFTAVMVKLANLPEAMLRMQWSSEVISLSFFSQVTSGKGSPEMLQVRLRACGKHVHATRLSERASERDCARVSGGRAYLALLDGDHVGKASCYSSTTWKEQRQLRMTAFSLRPFKQGSTFNTGCER